MFYGRRLGIFRISNLMWMRFARKKNAHNRKKQQNRRRFLKARVILRLPFRRGIFFHGNGTGIFLLLFNMIFV